MSDEVKAPERIFVHPESSPLVYQRQQCQACIQYVRSDLVSPSPDAIEAVWEQAAQIAEKFGYENYGTNIETGEHCYDASYITAGKRIAAALRSWKDKG